jgi:hypothetical protein
MLNGYRFTTALTLLGMGASLVACGGGDAGTTHSQAVNGTISGTAMMGPVAGAAVAAFAITGGAKAAQMGSGTTDPQGHFTVSVGDYAGPVLLEMSGGTYTDEAAGATMATQAGDLMTCVTPPLAAGATTTGLQVTPLTSIAQSRAQNMAGAMTVANVTAANDAIGGYFAMNDILHTAPMSPLAAGSGAGATQDMKNYGIAIAAMSQYAKNIGMTTSSGIVTAMMKDASDGVMNGMMGSTPVSMAGMGGMMSGTMQPTAGGAGLAAAMSQFVASAMNKSGVAMAEMQPLIDKLTGSSGQLAGAAGGSTAGVP